MKFVNLAAVKWSPQALVLVHHIDFRKLKQGSSTALQVLASIENTFV